MKEFEAFARDNDHNILSNFNVF